MGEMKEEDEIGFDQLKRLYPFVDEKRSPLPRCWSAKDKYQYLGLSQNNLRVHYKGQGKNHKDAAAVRANHPIPAACGLYYFEVRIVSKGRDGFMGIGLSQADVNLNRLPGWDKNSYGYHGDDGNSFCSSGSGVPYGPTFTTGDVIGCGLNLVDNLCFYTKNGHNIGVSFADLPSDLYPTVGLQTPGEVVDANFGQVEFMYDVYEEMKEVQSRIRITIDAFPLPSTKTECFNRLISSYLVHRGYSATVESFNRTTDQVATEDVASIKNREKIMKLILAGRITDAINTLQQLYPGLLERNKNLLFLLKCRQFIEMVAGNDEIRRHSPRSSNSVSPINSSTKSALGHHYRKHTPLPSPRDSPNSPRTSKSRTKLSSPYTVPSAAPLFAGSPNVHNLPYKNGCDKMSSHTEEFDGATLSAVHSSSQDENRNVGNGVYKEMIDLKDCAAADIKNGSSHEHDDDDSLMDTGDCMEEIPVCASPSSTAMLDDSNVALVQFGRELHQLSIQLKMAHETTTKEMKMMQDAFSLMAYSNPWKSSVSYQLSPSQREPIASTVNSAILEMQGYQSRPALEVIVAHANRLREEMARTGLGSSAFCSQNYYTCSPYSED